MTSYPIVFVLLLVVMAAIFTDTLPAKAAAYGRSLFLISRCIMIKPFKTIEEQNRKQIRVLFNERNENGP